MTTAVQVMWRQRILVGVVIPAARIIAFACLDHMNILMRNSELVGSDFFFIGSKYNKARARSTIFSERFPKVF